MLKLTYFLYRAAYPSVRPLGAWFADLVQRSEHLMEWQRQVCAQSVNSKGVPESLAACRVCGHASGCTICVEKPAVPSNTCRKCLCARSICLLHVCRKAHSAFKATLMARCTGALLQRNTDGHSETGRSSDATPMARCTSTLVRRNLEGTLHQHARQM